MPFLVDYITLDPLTSMPNDKTMEAWVRLDSPPTGTVQLISVAPPSGCSEPSMDVQQMVAANYTNDTAWINNNRPGNDGGFTVESWKHIAITITSNDFLDGVWWPDMPTMECNHDRPIGRHNVYGGSLLGDMEVRMSSAIEYSGGFTPQYPLPVTNNTELVRTDYGLSTEMTAATASMVS